MAYRIVRRITRPPAEQIAALKGARAGSIGRWVLASGAMDHRIQGIRREWEFLGPAITVHLDDPDTLVPMQAIDLAEPGDVLVVAAHGRMDVPCWGGGMTITSEAKGLAGAVIDGAVGDTFAILDRSFPVFARGSSPRFELRNLPGSINVPVVCGGVLVRPGDLVAGNADGVVVIAKERIDEVIAAWRAHQENLRRWGALLREGKSIFQAVGLDEQIRALPIVWEDGPAP
ncbi:MAG: S-adenosylmethionine--2-demethylmenaquinone methyltransferase [Dehalococcoidia bacterium]|jgi:4-hydroxy-4-methyl-2-oxoglutarate aldolase|nr:MAG: S-adenosylmethionine--2-demethylmenaquinone methyltransferase [Dehalococcoidia bacterium]